MLSVRGEFEDVRRWASFFVNIAARKRHIERGLKGKKVRKMVLFYSIGYKLFMERINPGS